MKVAFLGVSVLSLANALFAVSPAEDSEASQVRKLLIGWASDGVKERLSCLNVRK